MKKILLLMFLLPSFAFGYTEREHPLICAFAQARLQDIQGDFSHRGFYGTTTLLKVYDKIGHTRANWLPKGMLRENLARGFSKKEDVFKAWKNSPTHNANLVAESEYSCLRSANGHWVLITFLHIK
ncbi:MAG: hypothetical protein WAV09_01140 [Minisyncoccia bacterium]